MTKIIVDQDRCTQCGICATVCPLGLTFEADETMLPQALEKVAPFCLNCGHCEVSCPQGALTLNFALDEKSDDVVGLDGIPSGLLGTYLKSRRSVRHFTHQKVEKEKILQMHHRSHPFRYCCPVVWRGDLLGGISDSISPLVETHARGARAAAGSSDLLCHDVRLSAAQNLSHTAAKSGSDHMALR